MKLGIIGPSKEEIMPFIEKLKDKTTENSAMLTFYSGNFNNIDIVALYCGVCKVNAAIASQVLIDKFNVTHIIVVGVAGAIDKNLKIGDTVIGTSCTYHDVSGDILTEYHPFMKSIYFNSDENLINLCKVTSSKNVFLNKIYFGKIVTGEAFIDKEGREQIITKYNPLCVDMETASIAHVCYANNIHFLAIRSITDTDDESGIKNFELNLILASNNAMTFLEKILLSIKEFNNE